MSAHPTSDRRIRLRVRLARHSAGLLLVAGALVAAPTAHADAGTPNLVAGELIDPDYAAGEAAIEAKDWEAAIAHFSKVKHKTSYRADSYNWLGYATRNLGRYQEALELYREALRIDPRHRGAHEYIGETYLLLGRLAEAEAHLAELRMLCPVMTCEEFKDLKRAVDRYRMIRGLGPAPAR